MNLTKEQREIVGHDLRSNEILRIIAFAGTGKTTTLVEYAKARPKARFLYVAFNKSVQLEAVNKFPNNVMCKTAHSLAWQEYGSKYQGRITQGFKANTIKEALGLDNYEDAKFTIDCLMNYLVSDDSRASDKHIPSAAKLRYRKSRPDMPNLIELSNQLGRMMCNGTNENIGMLHDGYLKLYQLSKPVLNYDVILLDEAQDINPVIGDIVLHQDAARIVVGDPHQQIYSFRGARNVMGAVRASKTLYLTHSFRFDKDIARVANMILNIFKQETRKVVGIREKRPSSFDKGYTVLSRTNAAIFDEAVKLYGKHKISFVGGIEGYRLNRIIDVFHLYDNQRRKITDPYIKGFHAFSELKDFAWDSEDWEIWSVCKVVEKYGRQIPALVANIRKAVVEPHQAHILLSTVHKAKGLEWPNVHLASDFPNLIEDDEIVDDGSIDSDEINLIYVAVTRSMGGLRSDKECSIREFILKAKRLV